MKYFLILILLFGSIAHSQSIKMKNNHLKIIVFSKSNGYIHESVPAGITTLNELGAGNGWEIVVTEDSTAFSPENLKQFGLIIFLSVGGHVLNNNEQKAVEQFVESGKGLLAIHTGAYAEPDWKWYHKAIGTRFIGHPPLQKAKVIIEDRENPAMQCFRDSIWETEDEWYSFAPDPRKNVHVLARLDENSYDVDDNRWFKGVVQRMGDHPIVWFRRMGKGRVFQTGFGHSAQKYSDPVFKKHLKGAIMWTATENN